MHNLSFENEFYLHENEKGFPYQRLSTYPRFETEARGNSEMAYSILTPKYDNYFRLSGFQSSLLPIHFRYTVQIPVHTVTVVWHKTYSIWDAPL